MISSDVGRSSPLAYGTFLFERNITDADRGFRRAISMNPGDAEAHQWYGAVAAFDRGVRLRNRDVLDLAELAYAYAAAGRRSDAQQLLVELEARARREYVIPTAFAIVHMALGDEERAFDWLERAAAARDLWLSESIFYPLYNPLRSHPRYANLLRALRAL
jgi:tetratricopeptide (TPR) repeat protein